jgi:hypothetical protein
MQRAILGLTALHCAAALFFLVGGFLSRAYAYATCGAAGAALVAEPPVSRAAVLASAWGTCAALAFAANVPLAAIQAAVAAVAWLAEIERRALAREVIAWTMASRMACVDGARLFAKLAQRKPASEVMPEILNESFYITEQTIAEQRAVLDESAQAKHAQLSSRLPIALAGLALGAMAAGLNRQDPWHPLLVFCVGTLATAAATLVPNTILPESEIGAESAAAIRDKPWRGYAWAAGASTILLTSPGVRPVCLYGVAIHFAGAYGVSERNPVLFLAVALAINILVE